MSIFSYYSENIIRFYKSIACQRASPNKGFILSILKSKMLLNFPK